MGPEPMVVNVAAIDGPCGVGKSAVACQTAARLGFCHVDTGAMYRAVTWLALQNHVNLSDVEALGELTAAMRLEMDTLPDGPVRVRCNGVDVSQLIRERAVSVGVSEVADCETVRRALVARQREIGLQKPSVMEGRDITTVVFPDARWKFFLDAALDIRAQRRLLQMQNSGRNETIERVLKDLQERDLRDRIRPWGALQVAADAIVIDTSYMSQDQVVDLIAAQVAEHRFSPNNHP